VSGLVHLAQHFTRAPFGANRDLGCFALGF
jgi:hypothetical protein